MIVIELEEKECETIAQGLDALARAQHDAIKAGKELWPIREKLEAAVAKAKEPSEETE